MVQHDAAGKRVGVRCCRPIAIQLKCCNAATLPRPLQQVVEPLLRIWLERVWRKKIIFKFRLTERHRTEQLVAEVDGLISKYPIGPFGKR